MEKGYETWCMEREESVQVRVTYWVVGELARYKLDLVGVQEVRRDKGGIARAETSNFFYVIILIEDKVLCLSEN
jgi:hypothetical protein